MPLLIAIEGVSSSLTPTLPGSGEKAALGAVSADVVDVTQLDCPPEADVAQPAGNDGATTESKFCVKIVAVRPRGMAKLIVPRSAAPSCKASMAVITPPQVPPAVKLNDCVAGVPSVKTTP